jgi:hypothetical protein
MTTRQYRAPADVILDVLANGSVESTILGRETLAASAIAAYERYVENDRKRMIMLRQGGRVIRRSDRED